MLKLLLGAAAIAVLVLSLKEDEPTEMKIEVSGNFLPPEPKCCRPYYPAYLGHLSRSNLVEQFIPC